MLRTLRKTFDRTPILRLVQYCTATALLTASGYGHALVVAESTLQVSITMRDAQGNLVTPEYWPNAVIQNFNSATLNAVGDEHLVVLRDRRLHDLTASSVTAPTDASFDMASSASYSGGLSATYSVSGHSNVGRSYVTAYSGLDIALLIPAGGTFAIAGSFSGTATTIGYENNGVGQSAYVTAGVIVSPQFAAGDAITGEAQVTGTEDAPGFKTQPFTDSFSKSYTNPFEVPMYVYLSMNASLNLANSASAVPEPASGAMCLAGLAVLALARSRRRRKSQKA